MPITVEEFEKTWAEAVATPVKPAVKVVHGKPQYDLHRILEGFEARVQAAAQRGELKAKDLQDALTHTKALKQLLHR